MKIRLFGVLWRLDEEQETAQPDLDLDKLLGYVASDTQHFIVLLSDEMLHRVWGACEVTTAYLNDVNIRVVALPDVYLPYDQMCKNYSLFCNDISCLAVSGITIELVEDAIEYLSQIPHLYLPEDLNNAVMNVLTPIVASQKKH